jgi:hypothetical protein
VNKYKRPAFDRPHGRQFFKFERHGICVGMEVIATEVREALNHPGTVSFISAQITIANWYLDRAAQAAGETSSHYVHYARQAYDIVSRLPPKGTPDETALRVHQELSVLRERLRVVDRRHNGLHGRAAPSCTLLHDSALGESDS